mgnify:CR=1 FL=1
MCPRLCRVDRSKTLGFCGERNKIRIAKVIHNFMWEEPYITLKNGTCAIFFSGCNLKCSFCQNYKISRGGIGKSYSINQFVNLLKEIDSGSDETIDLITPTHFSYYILKALKIYRPKKKIIYNTSGYENEKIIKKLAKYVDIFLPDFKYFDSALSKKYSNCEDYFAISSKVIKLMTKLKPNIFKNGNLEQGVIIRHLILPDQTKDSLAILQYIKDNVKDPIISLMSQYTPSGEKKEGRKLLNLEYKVVLNKAKKLGLNKGFFQDMSASDENFIPEF